ncbi:GspH/FimT family pseudopilin [Desulfurobacterium sp.]
MKRNGFTLTELIVTIVIVGILSVIAVPEIITWIHQSKVRQIAEELTSDLIWSQSLAMEKGSSKVVINSDSYEIYAPVTNSTPIKTVSINYPITLIPAFSGGLNYVSFKRNKLPAQNGSITISGYGISYKITVSATSGRIYLQRL